MTTEDRKNIKLYCGDYLEVMKEIPDGSIDIVLCDLPYGTMKGAGLDGWNESSTQWDERLDEKKLFVEYERILRKNGMAVLFSQEPYTSELRNNSKTNMDFCYPLIWRKDHFANALIARKAPVSYFEDLSVFCKKHDRQLLNPLREYFREILEFIRLSNCKEVNKKLGHRKAEHCFYVDTSQFSLCTESTYNELVEVFGIGKMDGFKTFAECEEIEKKYNRTFKIPSSQNFVGNVLDFRKDYQSLHPTQKPVALLEYLIRIYTNEGDIVLDNCMGSGSTGVACKNLNRKFIGIEKEQEYFDIANRRIKSTAS